MVLKNPLALLIAGFHPAEAATDVIQGDGAGSVAVALVELQRPT
jgi:hypothetical protein